MPLTYDGHDLSTMFICGDPQMTILNATPNTVDLVGRNGSAFIGMKYGNSTVTFTVVASGTALERRNAFSTLGAWLDVTEPKRLVLPDTPDRYYLAVPSGGVELQRALNGEAAQLVFELVDPVAYGINENSVFSYNNSSITITVGGTAATDINIRTSTGYWSRPDATTGLWGFATESGEFSHLAIGTTGDISGSINSEQRRCTVNANPRTLTLDSVWLRLAPGEHTITRDYGSGRFTVSWHDRWY